MLYCILQIATGLTGSTYYKNSLNKLKEGSKEQKRIKKSF